MKRVFLSALSIITGVFAYGQDWTVKDIGVGIINTSEYDEALTIVKRGDKWSEQDIYNLIFSPGNEKVFATWIAGPPTNTFLDSNGLPAWKCEYLITYPDKTTQLFGPFGFYPKGYSTLIINTSSKLIGKWKIDYFITHREMKDKRLIGTRYFTLTQ